MENDGYDLGAQRRPISEDDLPAVTEEVNEYLRRLRAGESVEDFAPETGLVVAKERIAEDGEYNLSGERYHVAEVAVSEWPVVKLSEACEINPDTIVPETRYPNKQFSTLTYLQSVRGMAGFSDTKRLAHPKLPAARVVASVTAMSWFQLCALT